MTPRPSQGRRPVRVVLDHQLRIRLEGRLLRTAKACPVLIYTSKTAVESNPQRAEQIRDRGAAVLAYEGPDEMPDLRFLLNHLGGRGVQQVLVEGGARVAASFLQKGLVDEICVYIAPKILGAGGSTCLAEPLANLPQVVGLRHVEIKTFGEDVRLRGRLGIEDAAERPAPDGIPTKSRESA